MAWLEGRTAMVTGGAGGIGSEICEELAREGATVAVWDMDGAKAAELAASDPARAGLRGRHHRQRGGRSRGRARCAPTTAASTR